MSPENLFAVILGDKSAVKGGNGKVVNSSSNDRIFIYYSDHGGPGILGEFETHRLVLCCFACLHGIISQLMNPLSLQALN